jgi:pilus assembly protein FimV
MPFTHRSPIYSFALKACTAAVASAVLLSSAAHAAGLGKLTVLSALGQPLRAEIELTSVSSEEAAGLAAKLASADAFRAANIEFNPALLSLRFAVEQRSGRQYIKVSSTQPLNEPFVDLLLELSWNNGRLVREYTFLLDPAELRSAQPAQVAAAEPLQRPRSETPAARAADAAPASSRPQRPARAPEQAAADSPAATPAPRARAGAPAAGAPGADAPAAPSRVRVRPGDTLGRIAGRVKPVDISLDMMLVALYRANPDAFIGNNMNRLKSGQILSVPDNDTLRGSGEGEAHGMVVAHAADFNAYRSKLAGQVATSAPVKAPSASQSATGKISAKVEERPTAANESQDQLRLSKAVPSAGAGGQGAGSTAEDTIAKEKALAEAQARVKELERNVNDLEGLMTVKSKAGTEAVAKATQEAAAPPGAAAAAKPAAAKPAVTKAAPEPGIADMLMDNINNVAAGVAVLVLALFGLSRRRNKKDAQPAVEPSILGVPNEPSHAMFAESGGQSVDTNNSVFNSSFAPSASQLDTNEVDPVAEADVYIAYGRDAQAEEILKEALRLHPERFAVRLKLLEIYAARKDQRAFETQASEIYSMSRGHGDEWAQAAAMGLAIDPLNPLYGKAGAVAAAPSDLAAGEPGAQALLAQQLDDAFRAGPADAGFGVNLAKDDDLTALPDMAASSEAAARADEHVLDFDLGGLGFDPVPSSGPGAASTAAAELPLGADVPDLEFDMSAFTPAASAAETPTAQPADDLTFDLAFDTDFDAPTRLGAHPAPPAGDVADELTLDMALDGPATEIDMADLAKEFDLPGISGAGNVAPATELKDPLFDLDAMNFDSPATPAVAAAPAAAEANEHVFDFDSMDFSLPDTANVPAEVSFHLPEPATAPAPSLRQFDMSGIDLDLPEADGAALPLPDVGLAGGAGDMSAAQMEMETKLDLAIAYQEIGDKEGARELLDEVIKGGSSEQVSKANAMRASLA